MRIQCFTLFVAFICFTETFTLFPICGPLVTTDLERTLKWPQNKVIDSASTRHAVPHNYIMTTNVFILKIAKIMGLVFCVKFDLKQYNVPYT